MCLPVSFQILKELLFSWFQGKYLNVNLGIFNVNFAARINKARKFKSNAAKFVFNLVFLCKVFLLRIFYFFIFFSLFSSQQNEFITEPTFSGSGLLVS